MKYIIACVIGALIGYITNWLAIKMLFRPYTEKRIFGIKMPFTPGLIPKEQKRIAKTIGETISKHLLTKETIVSELCSEKIYFYIEKIIKNKIDMLSKSQLKLEDKFLILKDILISNLEKLHESKETNEIVKTILISKEEELKNTQTTITEFIGNESLHSIKDYLNKNKQSISLDILNTIKNPNIENKIKSAISSGISANVNPLMAMFINPDSIYEKIILYIESNIYKTDVQNEIILIVNGLIDKIGEKKVHNIIEDITYEDKEKVLDFLSNKISKHLFEEGQIKSITDRIFDIKISTLIKGKEEKVISELKNIIISLYSKFINENGEDILELLNVKKLIETQINSFPVEFTEKLIVDIANKELKAITWLGALLGGIMGILSPILSALY